MYLMLINLKSIIQRYFQHILEGKKFTINNRLFFVYKKKKLFSTTCLFSLLFFTNTVNAQNYEQNDVESVRSTLVNFSYTEFNLDFYKFNNTQYLLSQTGNGTLKLNENNFLNLEYNISNAWLNNSNYVVPGDFSFSYTYNYYGKNYLNKGFQGIATKMKIIIPTGKSEYLSGLGNWIVEPSIYFGWRLKNDKIYFAYKLRANFSIATLPNTLKSTPYARYESIIGYENDKFWVASTGDSRLTFDDGEYNLLLKLESGLKLNKSNGVFTSFTYSVIGVLFYEYYLNFGYYKTF